MHYTPLEKSILQTIAYFDLLDYPLTATEIWKWLYKPDVPASQRGLITVVTTLKESTNLAEVLSTREAFYCLRGREHLIPIRKRRNLRVDEQLKKTVRIVKLLRLIPAIRMIAIYNSLAIGNVKETSDIDLFIIARKDQIWRARFFAAGLLKLLGKRPTHTTTRDKFCLSFYITEDALDLERTSFGNDDIGFQYYIQNFLPIYDPDGLYSRFRAVNAWLQKKLPNAPVHDRLTIEVAAPRWVRLWHGFFDTVTSPFFAPPWEDWVCTLQLRILPDGLKSIANVDSRVIISDYMLKFHDRDTRQNLRRRWNESLQKYGAL